jgi:mannose-6-phosphate isomerase-like protein (cupin superfamily)
MELYHLADVAGAQAASSRPYLEFHRSPDLSTGLYVLPVGGLDRQSPHTEDEIYYVIGGWARMRVGDEEEPVGPGDVIFVPAGAPHKFVEIAQELSLLVVFGPAEASLATETTGQA